MTAKSKIAFMLIFQQSIYYTFQFIQNLFLIAKQTNSLPVTLLSDINKKNKTSIRLQQLLTNKQNQKIRKMEFFNKYKDLFGVPEGTPLPSKKISINNSLFVDKPFIPTYTESYNLNSKLKALKRDYDDLESQIAEIQNTPKRAMSRRAKQKTEESVKNSRVSAGHDPYQGNRKQKQHRMRPDGLGSKRSQWLHDEQKNLDRHSQIDFIFNHKIKQQGPKLKNPYENNIRAENFMFGSQVQPSPKFRKKNIQEVKTSRIYDQKDQENNRSQLKTRKNRLKMDQVHNVHRESTNSYEKKGNDEAVRRRNQAKRNINARRQKLSFLLRTSW